MKRSNLGVSNFDLILPNLKAHASLIRAPAILHDVRAILSSNLNERTASTSSIKESVSALEAFMNELAELGYGYESHGHKATTNSAEGILVSLGQNLRSAEQEKKDIRQKIQIAHYSLTSRKLAKGNTPVYQKFSLVVNIRNQLAHPKASVLDISNSPLTHPKSDQKMIKRLRSYGFKAEDDNQFDWVDIISNRSFALWAYQPSIDIMVFIFSYWPFKYAIDSYHDMYGLHYRSPETWSQA